MARPNQTKRLEQIPKPVIYMPVGWTKSNVSPTEISVEDFEAFRLVDGEGYTLDEAARKMNCSKSTVGRMVERGRRILACALSAKAPICIDAGEDSNFMPNACDFVASGDVAAAVDADTRLASVSRVFGRAPFFAVYEGPGSCEFLANPGKNKKRSAAREAVAALAEAGVRRVAAGRFGPDALEALAEAGIEPILLSGFSLLQFEELCIHPNYE